MGWTPKSRNKKVRWRPLRPNKPNPSHLHHQHQERLNHPSFAHVTSRRERTSARNSAPQVNVSPSARRNADVSRRRRALDPSATTRPVFSYFPPWIYADLYRIMSSVNIYGHLWTYGLNLRSCGLRSFVK